MNAMETNGKKKNINIDFAPMVDLGFLLITFFIFTTEMIKPKVFGLHVHDESEIIDKGTQAPESATITLLMKENGVIDFFEGREYRPLKTGSASLYTKPSLRDYLINKRIRIEQQLGSNTNCTVLIRPSALTSYKELIDVLDEMKITDIKKYVLLNETTANQ